MSFKDVARRASASSPSLSAPQAARRAWVQGAGRLLAVLALSTGALFCPAAYAQSKEPLKFGVGMFQPDKNKNDATYTPLARYLEAKVGRPVQLRTVDTWEGLAKSLANGETDIALLGPWGYVLANNESGAQAIATIQYNGKPEYFAIMVVGSDSKAQSIDDLKGKTFAFGDKGSTSGYLIPFHYMQKKGINPDTYFSRVIHTKHQAIEMSVTRGELDAGADFNRNRDTMIEQGLIKASESRIIWTSDPLPNDAFAVSTEVLKDKALVEKLQAALVGVEAELKNNPELLPKNYTGFVKKDNAFYKPIRDAGLATGKLVPR